MPRDASGIYSKPAGTTPSSGDTVASGQFNALMDDIAADLNAARPVVAGGTGATDAATALSNLGGAPLASPALIGVPTAPTAAGGTGTTQIATTAFVQQEVTADNTDINDAGGYYTGIVVEDALQEIGADIGAINATLSGANYPPTGMVGTFATQTAPNGWLECDGAAVSRTTYADLYAAIGNVYGAGDGVTTFNLPDLRGEFVRGWDNTRGVDAARVFGSPQAATVGTFTWRVYGDDGDSSSGAFASVRRLTIAGIEASTPLNAYSAEQTANVTPVDTRPRNVAMLFCIKT